MFPPYPVHSFDYVIPVCPLLGSSLSDFGFISFISFLLTDTVFACILTRRVSVGAINAFIKIHIQSLSVLYRTVLCHCEAVRYLALASPCHSNAPLCLCSEMPYFALPSLCIALPCRALAERRFAVPSHRSALHCSASPLLCFISLRPAMQFHCVARRCRAPPLPNATGLCSAFPLQNLHRFTLPLPNISMLRFASACLSYSMPLLYSTPLRCTMPSHCFSSLHFALPSHSVQSSAMLSHSLLVFIAANHFSVFVKFFPDKSTFARISPLTESAIFSVIEPLSYCLRMSIS